MATAFALQSKTDAGVARQGAEAGARTAANAGTRAARLIGERRARASTLGAGLADFLADPDVFVGAVSEALEELGDAEYRAGQAFIAPGIGPTFGVRTPLQVALRKGFERASKGASTSELIRMADRALRASERETRWFAITTLQRTLRQEPERTWQLLRRAAAEADDWVTIDTLAHPYGEGILAEPYRWAELEQLTISPSRWERRLVGSTIATMPHVDRRTGREPAVAATALPLLGTLIGDREPDVQKALSWAYRSMAMVDQAATTAALAAEAAIAAKHDDGHRAWVVRDSLSKLAPDIAADLRTMLVEVRRRRGGPSTSAASQLATRFGDMGLGRRMPEPPLT
jgi:3-methyladenine DNA glycosylase AlkD